MLMMGERGGAIDILSVKIIKVSNVLIIFASGWGGVCKDNTALTRKIVFVIYTEGDGPHVHNFSIGPSIFHLMTEERSGSYLFKAVNCL